MAGGRVFGTRMNFSRNQPPVYQQQSPANTRPYQAPWLLDNPGDTATPQSIHDKYSSMRAGGVGPYAPIVANGMYADSAATRRSNILKEMHGYQEQQARQQEINPSGRGLFSLPPERNPYIGNPVSTGTHPPAGYGGSTGVAPQTPNNPMVPFSPPNPYSPFTNVGAPSYVGRTFGINLDNETRRPRTPQETPPMSGGAAPSSAPPMQAEAPSASQTNPMAGGENPAVNLSGFQGLPANIGAGLAGLMPGLAGTATSGYLQGLGKGYGAAQLGPINGQPMPAGGNPAEWARARAESSRQSGAPAMPPWQGPIQEGVMDLWARQMSGTDPTLHSRTPAPRSSLNASANAMGAEFNPLTGDISPASVARANSYAPLPSITEGQQYGLGLPMDQAGQANRLANQNPMYAGMQGRFGAGSFQGQQAAAIQAGQAGVADGSMIDIPQGWGKMPEYNPTRPSPDVIFRTNEAGNEVSSIARGTNPQLDRQFDAMRRQTPNAERAAHRREAKAENAARRTNSRFNLMIGRGMNPMSPQAKAMFPEQTGGLQGAKDLQNPMKAMAPGSPKTPTSVNDASTLMDGMAKGNPDAGIPPNTFLSALGAGGSAEDTSVDNIHAGLRAMWDNKVDPAPSDLRSLREYLIAMNHQAKPGESRLTPTWFNQGANGTPDYIGLTNIPDDASDEMFNEWWTDARERLNPFQANPGQSPLTQLNPVTPPGSGGGIWSGAPIGR